MTDKEKLDAIRAEILRLVEVCGYNREMANDLLTFMDSLPNEPVSDFEMALTEMIDKAQKCVVEPWAVAAQWKDYLVELAKSEEPVSEELEEAAMQYAKLKHKDATLQRIVSWDFKAGAKWQEEKDNEENGLTYKHGFEDCKEQMMANTADAMIGLPYENKDGGYTHLIDVSRPLPVGNNKIAIIFKED